jgi:hypothetical protein
LNVNESPARELGMPGVPGRAQFVWLTTGFTLPTTPARENRLVKSSEPLPLSPLGTELIRSTPAENLSKQKAQLVNSKITGQTEHQP